MSVIPKDTLCNRDHIAITYTYVMFWFCSDLQMTGLHIFSPQDPFGRAMSLNRASIPASSSASVHSLPPCDVKRPLGKSMSIKSSWQPWTPVPKCEKESAGEVTLGGSMEGELGLRARHMSEPQRLRDDPLLFDLDNINLRTSDV